MDTDLEVFVPESRDLVHPATGELISLDDPRACVLAIKELRELETQLRAVKAALSRAVGEEAARQGTRTLHLEGVTVTVKEGKTIEWDLDQLAKLQDLGLPEERYNALVRTEITHKVSASEAKRIAGANPQYAEVIERARHDFDTGSLYVTTIEVAK